MLHFYYLCNLFSFSIILTDIFMNKTLSRALAFVSLCFALSATATNSYGLADTCQDGTILHCFDWSFNQIKEELPNIAAAGFTSVQTSPSQGNAASNAEWYFAYQPRDFVFADGGLGTKQDLKNLCAEAEKYGIKVIVDVVSNHLNGSMSYVASRWHNNEYWHTHGSNISYNNRWQITHGDIGMRDINSEHATVYNAVREYVDELKSYGVDGIRWDAAKHIGLPSEDCDFWDAVTKNSGVWHYGEILVGPTNNGDAEATKLMKEYTNYISVTDDEYGKWLRESIQGGRTYSNASNWQARGVASDKIVYWAESHDTYSNNGEYGTDSRSASVNHINRTYALLAARGSSTALYFSRPNSTDKRSIRLGQKGKTDFKNAEVIAVNQFHNAMIGQKEHYVCENGAMAVCREKGVVIVKASGSGAVSISNGGSTVAPGTYKDRLTGNTWTVTSSNISGSIGSTGIAVVYNFDESTLPDLPSGGTSGGTEKEFTAYFDNTVSNWSSVFAYAWNPNDNSEMLGAWPGSNLSVDSKSGYFVATASTTVTSPMIIFNNGSSSKTADLAWVNNGVYTISGYTGKTIDESQGGNQGGNNEPKPENKWAFYYNDTNWGTATVYAYVWDTGNGNKTYIGSWPGSPMTKNSNGMWEMSFTTTDNLITPMVIFNNGNGNGSNQTADFALKNNGVYNYNGWKESGVCDIATSNPLNITVHNGAIIINSDYDTTVSIIRADGMSKTVTITCGTNLINNLPKGFYIIKANNLTQKVIVK